MRRSLVPLVLVLLVAVGVVLRVGTIADWPLWIDEAFTWSTAHTGWRALLLWQHHPDHPPLSFALVRLTTLLLGTEAEWALRLPSQLAGILAIPAAFVLGREVGSRGAGLALAALVSVDPLLIMQARQARMYSLLILLGALVLAAFGALARTLPRARVPWVALGLGLAAAASTHLLGLVLWAAVLAGGVAEVVRRRRRRDPEGAARVAGGGALALAAAALITAPGLFSLGRKALESGGTGGEVGIHRAWGLIADYIAGTGAGAPMLAVVAAAGLVVVARSSPALAVALATTILVNFGAAVVAGMHHQFGTESYLIPARLVAWTCVAAVVAAPRGALTRALAGVAFVALLVLVADREVRPIHYRAGDLARRMAAADVGPVRYVPEWMVAMGDYYGLARAGPPPPRPLRTWVLIGHHDSLDADARATLAEVAEAYGTRWDPAEVDRRLRADETVAVGFAGDSVRMLSP